MSSDLQRRGLQRRVIAGITGIACLTLLLIISGCSKAPARPASEGMAPKKVALAQVQELTAEETVRTTGTLAAQDRAVLSVKVPGRLEFLKVDLGSRVKKGDLLAQIETTDYELRVKQSDAALAQARARLGLAFTGEEDQAKPEEASIVKEARAVLNEAAKNRSRTLALRQQGIIPEADVETAEATFQVTTNRYEEAIHEAKNRQAILKERQAELALAVQQLANTRIYAPFDGVVEQRQASPGEFLREGTPVLALVRVDPIRLRMEVAEKDAPRLEIGQKIRLMLEGDETIYPGRVGRLSPVISANNRMLQVEADLPNPEGKLRPGSFAKVEIVVNENRKAPFVPQSAVITFAGMQKVFMIANGKAVEKQVVTGRMRDGRVEILKGLKAGEQVVLEPGNLRSGQPVELEGRGT